jgi:hypothetical protein
VANIQVALQHKRLVARELGQRAEAIQAAIPSLYPSSSLAVASSTLTRHKSSHTSSVDLTPEGFLGKFPFAVASGIRGEILEKLHAEKSARRGAQATVHIEELRALELMPMSMEMWRLVLASLALLVQKYKY